MPFDDIPQSAGTVAAWIAGAGVAVLAAWKHIMAARRDMRTDQQETREQRGAQFADQVYRDLVLSLKTGLASAQERMEAMDKAIAEIGNDFRRERAARLEAEDRAIEAEHKRQVCERTLADVRDMVADCERRSEQLSDRVARLEAALADRK